jgi:ABC-2 type transport system permease protein
MTSRFAIQYSTTTEAWIALGLQLIGTIAVAKVGEKIYARNVLSYSDDKILSQLWRNITGREARVKPAQVVNEVDASAKKAWFRKKRSGIGYTPQTWQGWLIMIVVILVIVAVVRLVRG